MSQISMPVADLLKGQLHVTGWKKGKIVWVAEKESKDKQSRNYTYGFEYTEANGDKREISALFNSKALGFMTPFLAAIANMSVIDFAKAMEAKGSTFTFEWNDVNFKDKELQVKIENKPRNDNGQLKSEITDYAPINFTVPF